MSQIPAEFATAEITPVLDAGFISDPWRFRLSRKYNRERCAWEYMTGAEGHVHATSLSLSILEHISNHGSATLSELADEFDISTSTAHNHLATLTDHRILTKSGREYKPGIRLFRFGQQARSSDQAYRYARETVQSLAQTTSSEADFLVEDDGRMLSIFGVTSSSPNPDFSVGEYYYMHTSATGKALLATYPDERVEKIIDRWGLPKQTEHAITDQATLFDELEQIREQGYAVNDQEIVEGLYSVGMVVNEPDDSVFGAISVGGPTYRLTQETIDDVLQPLRKSVDQLETQIRDLRQSPN